GLVRGSSRGGDGNDVVRDDIRGNKANLIQGVHPNAMVYHERNEANGDIEVVTAARYGGAHERRPEDTRGQSLAACVSDHLFGHPFGLAVAEVEKLHVLVEVGLPEGALHRPAKDERGRNVIELLGPALKR